MFRWMKELVKPDLKCARVGHKPRKETRRGLTKETTGFRSVADEIKQVREVCRRCGATLKDWETVDRMSIHDLTLPGDDYRKLEENGVLWMD